MSETIQILSNDLERDIKWYSEKLGFHKSSANIMIRGDLEISFIQKEELEKSEYRLLVRNLDKVFKSLVETGVAKMERPPAITFFGTSELALSDLNGHKIIFFEEH